MNFMGGMVAPRQACVVLEDGSRIEISKALAAIHAGRLVQIGLRPEALSLVPAGTGAFDATFDFVEELGPARLYHFKFEDLTIAVLSADKPPVQVGQPMGLKIAPEAVHLFAADTGKRLEAPARVQEAVLA
jgi:sn-glycerol 3-phosphate transport system ATP-binding protein